jgi:protein-disulfide isomerase
MLHRGLPVGWLPDFAVTCGVLMFAHGALIGTPLAAYAQFAPPQTGTQVKDASALKPPLGARVAIVEFADLECPACASANPLLKQAVATYKIPWLRHDFLIPSHRWSTQAAVYARWFDSRDKKIGNDYRDAVFTNQSSILNQMMLRQFTERFATSHGVVLPFDIDPQGKLVAQVQADSALGRQTGIWQTPTIFVVTADSKGAGFIEVVDRSKLFQVIDRALEDTKSSRTIHP